MGRYRLPKTSKLQCLQRRKNAKNAVYAHPIHVKFTWRRKAVRPAPTSGGPSPKTPPAAQYRPVARFRAVPEGLYRTPSQRAPPRGPSPQGGFPRPGARRFQFFGGGILPNFSRGGAVRPVFSDGGSVEPTFTTRRKRHGWAGIEVDSPK